MATSSQVVTSALPTAFETYYTAPGDAEGKGKGLIPQAMALYGAAEPKDFAKYYVDPFKTAGVYGTQRVAELQPYQTQVGTALSGMTTPTQFAGGTSAAEAGIAGLRGLTGAGAQTVSAPSLQQYQMGPADIVYGQQYTAPSMVSAQTGYAPQLTTYQLGAPQTFGAEQAQQYMSPFMQNVVDVQKREAVREAEKAQLAQNLGAARQGTYGGARQTLAASERERNLMRQLGDIQARGSEAAFTQAQQQFERDRAAQMGTAQQNLAAALGVQQLGTQTGLQTSLANLSAQERANVQNQAAILQTQGLNAQQALQAALANQQAGIVTGQQNLSALLGVQQLGAGQSMEAQRANQAAALQAQQQQLQAGIGLGALGQQLGQIGIAQQAADIDRLKTLGAYGDLQRALEQQKLDIRYQDVLQGVQFPEQQLEKLTQFIRGVPLTDYTKTVTTPPPSFASQLAGLGLSGLSLYKLLNQG